MSVDRRAVPRNGDATTTYRRTVRLGDENHYSFGAPNGDPWIDRWLLAFDTPSAAELLFEVDHRVEDGLPAILSVDLWGATVWPEHPDHHVVVYLNGEPVGEAWFDGQRSQRIEVALPQGLLVDGKNVLTIELPGDTGVPYDLIAFNHAEITYSRQTVAIDGRLTFDATGTPVEVRGLPSEDVTVYRETDGEIERLGRVLVGRDGEDFVARFRGAFGPARYFVSTPDSSSPPRRPRHNPWLTSIANLPTS